MSMRDYLKKISEGQTLKQEEAEQVMHLLMRGEASGEETAGLLMGLRSRGETLDELVGFTRVMRSYAIHVECRDTSAIDLCGTGGDHSGTFNISTAASFVCAGAGVTVAKHGNRSVSSKSGSADVLEALGVRTKLGKEGVEHCLQEAGIAFIFAPFFHPALKHVMPVRRALGVRSFFNILGPLCNPASVTRQLVGAFSDETASLMAKILQRLGSEHVLTAHSEDGLDEISIAGNTTLHEAKEGGIMTTEINFHPSELGIDVADLSTLQGGTAEQNGLILKRIFTGDKGPQRNVVVLNAAAALYVSGRFGDIEQARAAAEESIDSGATMEKLEALKKASREADEKA